MKSIGQRKAQDGKYIFSLNERLLGKRIPAITDENKGNFPCFNLFQEDNANMSGHTYPSVSACSYNILFHFKSNCSSLTTLF
jgi:hypothetical protein